jgi:hypothetical protein
MKTIIIICLCVLIPLGALAEGDGWRIVVIDGVNYLQIEEQSAVQILAKLEQNEIRRAELEKAAQNQRNMEIALRAAQKDVRTWRAITVVVSGVALCFLGAAALR